MDRWQKKAVLVTTNLMRAGVVVAFLPFLGAPFLLYGVNLVFATIAQFFAPAELATIPLLIPRHQLISANGLFNLTFYSSQLVGFVLVGPIVVKIWGGEALFPVIAGAFVAAAALVSFLPQANTTRGRGEEMPSMVEELKEGWQLLRGENAVALSLSHLTLTGALMLIIGMLVPGFASRVMGIKVEDAVFLFAPAGVGIITGIGILPRLTLRLGKQQVINVAMALLTLSLIGLGGVAWARNWLIAGATLPGAVAIVMAASFVMGGAYAGVAIPAQTILQEKVPPGLRGRIFATQLVLANVASLLPLLFLGSLADLIGIGPVLFLTAALVLAVALIT
ncbi:MAG TPA: MFS transporter, partial [Dehalococcoidia bacterium]|nr:MFS transporter [Dehalococcoidia bacterium]